MSIWDEDMERDDDPEEDNVTERDDDPEEDNVTEWDDDIEWDDNPEMQDFKVKKGELIEYMGRICCGNPVWSDENRG